MSYEDMVSKYAGDHKYSFKVRQILEEIRQLKQAKDEIEAEIAQFKKDHKDSWYGLEELRKKESAIYKKIATADRKYRKQRALEDNVTLL